jgi:hypothetical protein
VVWSFLATAHASASGGISDAGVASIVAASAALVSAFFAGLALREARKAQKVPALLDFVREYRQYEDDRRYVLLQLRDHDPRLGTSRLPAEARRHVVNVCHYLDHLGSVVRHGLIDLEVVAGLMGESILMSWGALAPYIYKERERRGLDYAGYFEDLARQVYDIGPKVVRKALLRMPANANLPTPFMPDEVIDCEGAPP